LESIGLKEQASTTADEGSASFLKKEVMKVEILSVGCAKCNKFFAAVNDLVQSRGIDVEIVKVEDMAIFCKYGVFMLPALVIDGEVKVAGKLPNESELMHWLAPATIG
jgi:small redox-active disulfide protein 2